MHRVGCHDAACDIFDRSVLEFVRHCSQSSTNILHWILTANNTSRGDQHIICLTSNFLRNSTNNFTSIAHAFGACGDVGIFRNHNYGSRRVADDVFATDNDTWPSKTALSKHTSGGANTFGNDKSQILCRVFNADVCDVGTKTLRQFHAPSLFFISEVFSQIIERFANGELIFANIASQFQPQRRF